MSDEIKKVKRTVLFNTGKVFDEETGEILEPTSDNYKIIIEDI